MKKFWNWIKNSDNTRILRLEGPIDEESFWGDEITPRMFRDELESGEGNVTVWINSPGGNVFAAAEIYTMLKDYKGSITVKIDAIAASAASVVAMAGDTVQMSPVAMLMIHDGCNGQYQGHGKGHRGADRSQGEHHQRLCCKERTQPCPYCKPHEQRDLDECEEGCGAGLRRRDPLCKERGGAEQ